MKKKRKQIIALLMALIMFASLLPVGIWKTDTVYADTTDFESRETLTNQGLTVEELLKDRVNRSYSVRDLLLGKEQRASFSTGSGTAYLASCFPETAAVNTYYGQQLNNPERYLYRQLASFYAGAAAQRGVNSEVDFEVGEGYPFENYQQSQFESLYETCSNEIFVYWGTAIHAFLQDNPQYDVDKIRYYGACFLIYQDEETGLITGKITARVGFYYTGSTADIYDRYHAMQNVKNEASFQGDRFEKVREIHEYVCQKTEYAFTETSEYCAYGALVEGKAVCQGYALAFKFLCDKENIPCLAIGGRAGGSSHMWNAVQMEDGAWYAVDTTWDDQGERIHKDYCLIGRNSVPIHFGNGSFAQSHIPDMSSSQGEYADALTVPVLSSTVYGGVPLSDDGQKLQITVEPESFAYNGGEHRPAVAVNHRYFPLEEEVDYTVSYQNNRDAGKGQVVLDGTGSYEGNITREFSITKPLSDCQIIISPESVVYAEPIQMPSVTVKDGNKTLTENVDYEAVYPEITGPGEAWITVNGKGGYTGSETRPFTVIFEEEKKDISGCKITVKPDHMAYTGPNGTYEPSVKVKDENKELKEGIDYQVSYQNNSEVGKAEAIVEGIGAYMGSVSADFWITKAITKCQITGIPKSVVYTGKAQEPSVVIKDGDKTLNPETDYNITYKNNLNAGKATIIITGKGAYTGSVNKTFRINKAEQEVNCPTETYAKVYGCKAFRLDVKVPKGQGALSYKNSNSGVVYVSRKGKITVRGMGIAYITAKAGATKNYKASEAKIITVEVRPRQQVITQLRTKGSGKIEVKCRPDIAGSGYKIECAPNISFKKGKSSFTVNGGRSASKTISKLKKGKRYYVRVCSFKRIKRNGKAETLDGAWSAVKKIKVK